MAQGPRLTSSGALYIPGTFDEVTYSPSGLTDSKNLYPNSQDFSTQGYWIAAGASRSPVATDAVAPDGTLTASLFTATGLYPNFTNYYAGFQGIVAQPGEVYTFSVYLKYVNQPVACLVQEDGWSGFYTIVNIQTGTIVANGFAITSSSVTDAGNGWYRCTATFTVPSLQASWTNGQSYYNNTTTPIPVIKFNPQIRLGNYDGTNYAGKQMLVWGVQVELGSTATTYQPTGIPANYFKFTQNFSRAGSGVGSWLFYQNAATASDNVILAPNGTMTGGILVSTVGPGAYNTAFIDQHPTVLVNNTNFTYSIYLKQGTSPTTLVDFYNSNPYNEITATVTWGPTPTMVTGTTSGGVVVASSFTAAPNGWYRVSLTINTLNNVGVLNCRVYVRGQGNDNVAGEYVYIWGAQLEQGSAPTVYVANGINITKIKQLTQVFNNNLLTYSQSFGTAPWSTTLTTIGATTTAPDGTNTAQKLVCSSDVSAQFHSVSQSFTITQGSTFTFSVFVKAAELTNVGVYQNAGNNGTQWNLSTQALIFNDTGVTSTLNASTNGWYRITNTYTYASAGTYSVRIYLMNPGTSFIGDGTSGIYIWGAQLEFNNCISAYQANQATATRVLTVTQAASKSTTDGSVLIPGTFDEVTYNSSTPTIVNLLSYTEQFDNEVWSTIGTMTVTANSAIAPDNTLTADTLILGNGLALNSSARGQQYTKSAVPDTYTFSVYAKPAGFNSVRIYFRDNSNTANNVFAIVNVSTGAVTTAPVVSGTFTNPSGIVTDVGNGWYRISVTATTSIETTIRAQVYTYDSVASVGNGTSGVYFWGFQFESGSTPSIYQGKLSSTQTTSSLINLLRYSQDLSQTSVWGSTNATLLANNTTAPDSTGTGNFVRETVATGEHSTATSGLPLGSIKAVNLANPYTFSVYAKAAGRTKLEFVAQSWTTYDKYVAYTFDLTAVTAVPAYATSGSTIVSATITSVGNGWYRCSMNGVTLNSTNTTVAMILRLNNGSTTSYTGDGTSGMYIWGGQIETGSTLSVYQGTGLANLLAPTFAGRTTNTGQNYVVSNYDEVNQPYVSSGLLLDLDPSLSPFVPSAATLSDVNNPANVFTFTYPNNYDATTNSSWIQFTRTNSLYQGGGGQMTGTGSLTSANFLYADHTWELWIRIDDIQPSGVSVTDQFSALAVYTGYHSGFFCQGGNLLYVIWDGTTVGYNPVYWTAGVTGAQINQGTWYQVAVTRSGNTFAGYRNGVALGTVDNSHTYAINALVQNNISVGRAYTAVPGTTNGYLGYSKSTFGGMRMYNRALTAAEILQNFNASRNKFGI